MTNHDYNAALETMKDTSDWVEEHLDTIRHALKLADKLIQEPSEGMMMNASTCQKHDPFDMSCVSRSNRMRIFKAMRDQMLREVE